MTDSVTFIELLCPAVEGYETLFSSLGTRPKASLSSPPA